MSDKRVNYIADVTGVILAGGQSSRFGKNKALAMLDGKTLIKHIVEKLSSLFSACLLVTNTPELYNFLKLPMSKDIYPSRGPLSGIHSALNYIDTPKAFITGCDMPFVNEKLIRYLCSMSENEQYDATIPFLEKGPEPLCGVYLKTAFPIIDEYLKKDVRKISQVIDALRVQKILQRDILSVDPDLLSFYNVNRPGDLEFLSNNNLRKILE